MMAQVRKIQLGERNGQQVGNIQGTYRGQPVIIIQDTKPSAIQLASSIAGFEATRQKLRKPILLRHIVSKKVFKEKEKILSMYTERLGQSRQSRQYKEVYADLSRQQYKQEYYDEENPDELRDILLYKIAENFGEVTEQDNVLEYAMAINEIEHETIEIETEQIKKMVEFFSNPQKNTINIGFANTERMKWSDKLATLEENLKANAGFKVQLLRAQELLRKTHKQEIRDGYNLIPKAAAVLNQHFIHQESEPSALSFAISYRDEVLGMTNPLDVFEVFIRRQEKTREHFRPYIDAMIALFGVDMTSSNPSRSKEELLSVREGLFRIEICGQIYDSVGTLGHDIRRIFLRETIPFSTNS